MVYSKTCLFYLSKGVTIRGYFSKPQGETLLYPIVFCNLADDDELQGHVGEAPHFLFSLDGIGLWFARLEVQLRLLNSRWAWLTVFPSYPTSPISPVERLQAADSHARPEVTSP